MDIITCHTNADFDCLSSMVGVQKLFPEGKLVFPGAAESPVREFLKSHPLKIEKIKDIDFSAVKRLIIVDTKDPERIGDFKKIVDKKGTLIFIFDHHPPKENDIEGVVENIVEVGATATIITEIIKKKKLPFAPMEATLLCLGIYEETGSLRFTTTTERDVLAVAFLLKRGANLKVVSAFVKPGMDREALAFLNEIISTLVDVVIHGVRIKIGIAVRESYFDDAAHVAHNIMEMENIDALLLILNMEGKIVLIGRSRVTELNMADLMLHYGGGGHQAAASAVIEEVPPDILKEEIIERLKVIVRTTRLVKDIMTSPVITIQWNSSLKEAEKLMTMYNINVLPVIKNGVYKGFVSREVVEKAIFHGFIGSKAMEFATTDAETTGVDTPVKDIEELMIEQNQRFMPVIKKGVIVGAITRTDLLRVLYEDYLKKSRLKTALETMKNPVTKSIPSLLGDRLPVNVLNLLKKVGEIADEAGINAYVVGGFVRDLLRAEKNMDIDIVVEGEGIEFAGMLAKRVGGRITIHRRFGTAKIMDIPLYKKMYNKTGKDNRTEEVKPESAIHLDIATARTEYYEEPAALPKVEVSSIKKDLYRRDFTINTLAIKLNMKNFGALIDFFGGRRDLRDGMIRVLHNLSFIEDPTRAIRAVRFSERFGFKISKHTEKLIRSALKFELFDKLSGTRLYDELLITFKETEPAKILKRLSRYGLLKVLHPSLLFTGNLESLLQRIHDTISWYNLLFLEETIDSGSLCLMVLISDLNEEEREVALRRLATPVKIEEKIINGLKDAEFLAKTLSPDDPVNIFELLKGVSVETMLFIMARHVDKKKQKAISNYLIRLKNIKPEIKGKDLIEIGIEPGPRYSKIFNNLLREKLRGRLKDKEEELNYVQKNWTD